MQQVGRTGPRRIRVSHPVQVIHVYFTVVLDFDCKLSLWKCTHPPELPGSLDGGLVLGKCLAHGTGLLWAEIQRLVFLALK